MSVRDVASAAAQVAPPVAVTGAQFLGHAVGDWILYATGVYLVCQFIVIAPKVWRTIRGIRK